MRYFGQLSFWRCTLHPWIYLRWLDDLQTGKRLIGDPPPDEIRYRGGDTT